MKIGISKKPTFAIASFFIVMLTLNFFGGRRTNDPQLLENSEFPQREIEAYSEGINSILYDENGSISYTLRADNQIHYRDGDTRIENPLIRLFQDEIPRWNIIASEGLVLPMLTETSSEPKTKKLTLSGNVEILGLDKFGNRTFIYTELLEIDPINETLKTDRRVNYESNNIHHSSVGMFANLNEDQIRFEKNVRGFYEKISD